MYDEETDKIWQKIKMSPADKLFEELGYRRMNTSMTKVKYINSYDDIIEFDLKTREISSYKINATRYVDMQELKAINAKVKELGWE